MRWRLVAFCSLGVNLLLAAGWYFAKPRVGSPERLQEQAVATAAASDSSRTNYVVRRQLFSWREVESSDYATYIANLRQIGCPEQTIRDIIIADVNAMFSRRMATELVTADQQWWRTEPDPQVLLAAAAKARELDDERRTLLTGLLGPNWEGRDLTNLPRPSRPGVTLDGPVLGVLPAEAKDAVQEISLRSEERIQAYLQERARQGLPPDPAELAKMRQQTRQELARVLPPPELEEFLLRYSDNAESWRSRFGELRFFNPSQEEFRSVFRATDSIDARLEALTGDDPATVLARRALEAEREQAIKLALGPKRYEEYRNLQDPLYREAVATATAAGQPDAARVIYQVNLAASQELERITNSPDLTARQKEIEMRELELEQLKANTLATGQDLPPEPAPAAPPRRTYTFRPGDSAAVVALIHGVPLSALRAANPNVDLNRLRPGDSINIPRGALTPPSGP